MKIILILCTTLLLVVLITIPSPKRIHPLRLLTLVILMLYCVGMLKLIFLFPFATAFLLGGGFLAVLSIAVIFRQKAMSASTDSFQKTGQANGRRAEGRSKRKHILTKKEYAYRAAGNGLEYGHYR